jgi:hypothetical protein
MLKIVRRSCSYNKFLSDRDKKILFLKNGGTAEEGTGATAHECRDRREKQKIKERRQEKNAMNVSFHFRLQQLQYRVFNHYKSFIF